MRTIEQVFSLLLLVAAANTDTFFLAAGWSLRGRRLTHIASLTIASVTSIITAFSLGAGCWTAGLLTETAAKITSAILIAAIGLWLLIQRPDGCPEPEKPQAARCDLLLLAILLAINNIGMGLAAGLAGMSPLAAGILNFAISLLALYGGNALGCRCRNGRLSEWADRISGGLLLLLGAVELIF